MKRREFEKIEEDFNIEESRWESLKIGDCVYETGNGYLDMDVFEIEITEINKIERYIIGKDKSQNNKIVKLSGFLTKNEL